MLRREFIKATGTLLAATTLPGTTAFASSEKAKARFILPMNRGWRYHPAKVEGAQAPEFDDSSFERSCYSAYQCTPALA